MAGLDNTGDITVGGGQNQIDSLLKAIAALSTQQQQDLMNRINMGSSVGTSPSTNFDRMKNYNQGIKNAEQSIMQKYAGIPKSDQRFWTPWGTLSKDVWVKEISGMTGMSQVVLNGLYDKYRTNTSDITQIPDSAFNLDVGNLMDAEKKTIEGQAAETTARNLGLAAQGKAALYYDPTKNYNQSAQQGWNAIKDTPNGAGGTLSSSLGNLARGGTGTTADYNALAQWKQSVKDSTGLTDEVVDRLWQRAAAKLRNSGTIMTPEEFNQAVKEESYTSDTIERDKRAGLVKVSGEMKRASDTNSAPNPLGLISGKPSSSIPTTPSPMPSPNPGPMEPPNVDPLLSLLRR